MKALIDAMLDDIEKDFKKRLSKESEDKLKRDITVMLADIYFSGELYDLKYGALVKAENLPKAKELFSYLPERRIKNCTLDGDFSFYDFKHVVLKNVKFTKESILPKERDFFKTTKFENVELPYVNLNDYDMEGCLLSEIKFTVDSVLPKNRDFFKKLQYGLVRYVLLPEFDMNDYDFTDVRLSHVEFTKNTMMSLDLDFFQKLSSRSIHGCTMPQYDYSDYKFRWVGLSEVKFTKESLLPQNEKFFKNLHDHSIAYCELPKIEMDKYDWDTVRINNVEFATGTTLPQNADWLQKIKDKDMSACILPSGDYRRYDFSGVNLKSAKFTVDSLLPVDLFSKIVNNDCMGKEETCIGLPDQLIREYVLGCSIDDDYYLTKCDLSEGMLKILHAKFKNNPNMHMRSMDGFER